MRSWKKLSLLMMRLLKDLSENSKEIIELEVTESKQANEDAEAMNYENESEEDRLENNNKIEEKINMIHKKEEDEIMDRYETEEEVLNESQMKEENQFLNKLESEEYSA
jgi:hypothetical protein